MFNPQTSTGIPNYNHLLLETHLISVPDQNQLQRRSLSVSHALYWKRYTYRMRSGDKTKTHHTLVCLLLSLESKPL